MKEVRCQSTWSGRRRQYSVSDRLSLDVRGVQDGVVSIVEQHHKQWVEEAIEVVILVANPAGTTMERSLVTLCTALGVVPGKGFEQGLADSYCSDGNGEDEVGPEWDVPMARSLWDRFV